MMFRPFIVQTKNTVVLIIKRSAGHSKWQNIRHTKALKDFQRSQIFSALGQKIKVAIQENGSNINPETNVQLAHAIEAAKKQFMPAATIQNFIKNTQADKDKIKSLWLTVKGPRGSMLLISTLSSNFTKTKNEIASVLKRNGGTFADGGRGFFEQKGIIVAIPSSDLKDPTEVVEEHAIEAGAEDVKLLETTDNSFLFTCDMQQLSKAQDKLIELKYTIQESDLIYIAKISAPNLSDEEMETVSKLITKLENHPDVVCIYDNIG